MYCRISIIQTWFKKFIWAELVSALVSKINNWFHKKSVFEQLLYNFRVLVTKKKLFTCASQVDGSS